ncbi:unnamed protein product [Ranitomeya imitator]|uniref:Uncharacterized protein n=1 Tax=Ranitomeya imitator TaxID=111125 RepID=A0ABN9L565_9NEOB|nr:unnamed protein product [Ranitomeya imitator]
MKAQKAESGSSPSKKRVPFADQLQFILTSRNLRRTEGNVRAETPPVHEDNSLEHGDGEEVEDYPMCSSPNPPLPRQSSSMHAAVMPPTCTVASSSSAVDAAVVSSAHTGPTLQKPIIQATVQLVKVLGIMSPKTRVFLRKNCFRGMGPYRKVMSSLSSAEIDLRMHVSS